MKNIKKVNEFLNDEVQYTPDEIEKMDSNERIMIHENIEKLGIKKKRSSQISKDTYNKIINRLREDGELTLTFEEINKTHIVLFGCPYIEPKNNNE